MSSSKKNSQIYVARFSRNTNEDDLNDSFKQYGKIKEISMKNGYAFIVKFFFKLFLSFSPNFFKSK